MGYDLHCGDTNKTDQRGQPRIPCTLSVQVHAPTEDVLLFTYATNVSASGAFVRANRLFPVGTRVQLELQQIRGDHVKLDSVVVRVADKNCSRGMGLNFVKTDPVCEHELGRLLARRAC